MVSAQLEHEKYKMMQQITKMQPVLNQSSMDEEQFQQARLPEHFTLAKLKIKNDSRAELSDEGNLKRD